MLRKKIVKLIKDQVDLTADEIESLLEKPSDGGKGDYALACFKLAKKLKKAPTKIAVELAARLKPTGLIREIKSVAGYINFFVDPDKLVPLVMDEILKAGDQYGRSDVGQGKTVVIDYSSPNIAKPFGIGHLRSTVIGHSLYKIYTALGYRCVGINHLGDWGTQFGKLIEAFKQWGDSSDKDLTVSDLNNLYIKFHEAGQSDDSLKEKARQWFKKLEDGDPETTRLWSRFREISIKEFERVYRLLGVQFDHYQGEAFYNKFVEKTVQQLDQKGLLKLSAGAYIVDLKKYGLPPCLIKKKDEAALYATRDIAAAIHRAETYQFHKLIYVVGSDQKLHFRQFFKVLELMGCDWVKNCVHVDFGLVRFKGAKMSTRKGQTILLEDVLNKTIELSRKVMAERVPELKDKVTSGQAESITREVGIGAVIFNDLKNRRIKDTDFNWDQMLSFTGETGPYLQYTHVRLVSLRRKAEAAGIKMADPDAGAKTELLKLPAEIRLVKKFNDFSEVIQRAAREYEPSVVTNYLLEMASLFNRYYSEHRIISDDSALSQARLGLCRGLKHIMHHGLSLLGIIPLEEM